MSGDAAGAANDDAGAWWRVCDEAALSEGGACGAECGGHLVAVFRTRGELHATDSLCTHAFVPLQDGILDGYEIECPVHQARFDVRDGACTRFPATRPLRNVSGAQPQSRRGGLDPRGPRVRAPRAAAAGYRGGDNRVK